MELQDLFFHIGKHGNLYLCYYYCINGFDFSYDKIIGAWEGLIDYGIIDSSGHITNENDVVKYFIRNKKVVKGIPLEGEYIACYKYKDKTHYVVKNVATDKILFNSLSECPLGDEDKTQARYIQKERTIFI